MQLSAASAILPLLMLAAAAASNAAYKGVLRPKAFKCKLDDTDCLEDYLQNDVIRNFSTGFPQFGVEPLDPLQIGELTFKAKISPGVWFDLTHTDAVLRGLEKTKVLGVRVHISGSSVNIDTRVSTPELFYEGSYTLKGGVLFVPINWSGNFNMTLGDILDTWKLKANLVQKGKGVYLALQSFSFSPKVTTFRAYASGLFDDFEELGDYALKFTNKYWRPFFDVMWELAEPEISNEISESIISILSNTPITGLASTQLLPSASHDSVAN